MAFKCCNCQGSDDNRRDERNMEAPLGDTSSFDKIKFIDLYCFSESQRAEANEIERHVSQEFRKVKSSGKALRLTHGMRHGEKLFSISEGADSPSIIVSIDALKKKYTELRVVNIFRCDSKVTIHIQQNSTYDPKNDVDVQCHDCTRLGSIKYTSWTDGKTRVMLPSTIGPFYLPWKE